MVSRGAFVTIGRKEKPILHAFSFSLLELRDYNCFPNGPKDDALVDTYRQASWGFWLYSLSSWILDYVDDMPTSYQCIIFVIVSLAMLEAIRAANPSQDHVDDTIANIWAPHPKYPTLHYTAQLPKQLRHCHTAVIEFPSCRRFCTEVGARGMMKMAVLVHW
jgi:hypothetical protein